MKIIKLNRLDFLFYSKRVNFSFIFVHFRSQYFDLIGRCVATLKDVQNKVSSHTLEMGNQLVYSRECKNSSSPVSNSTTIHRNSVFTDQSNETSEICDLPLFGNICYRLIAQPHSTKLPLKSGYLWIRVSINICTVKPFSIQCIFFSLLLLLYQ